MWNEAEGPHREATARSNAAESEPHLPPLIFMLINAAPIIHEDTLRSGVASIPDFTALLPLYTFLKTRESARPSSPSRPRTAA